MPCPPRRPIPVKLEGKGKLHANFQFSGNMHLAHVHVAVTPTLRQRGESSRSQEEIKDSNGWEVKA